MKPKKAYIVVRKNNPKISTRDIFDDTDVRIAPDEILYEVEIRPIKPAKSTYK